MGFSNSSGMTFNSSQFPSNTGRAAAQLGSIPCPCELVLNLTLTRGHHLGAKRVPGSLLNGERVREEVCVPSTIAEPVPKPPEPTLAGTMLWHCRRPGRHSWTRCWSGECLFLRFLPSRWCDARSARSHEP